jgi:hypothetical protein
MSEICVLNRWLVLGAPGEPQNGAGCRENQPRDEGWNLQPPLSPPTSVSRDQRLGAAVANALIHHPSIKTQRLGLESFWIAEHIEPGG